MDNPLVGVLMGSRSDWDTMQHVVSTLDELDVGNEVQAISAHRTPDAVREYVSTAEGRGLEVIIAGAGRAAHLAGVVAAHTVLPVIGVPMQSSALQGLDSLLSTVQMPGGIPVATVAIGKAGAVNAALLATQILGVRIPEYREAIRTHRDRQREKVMAGVDPRQ